MAFSPSGTRATVEQVLRVGLLLILGYIFSAPPTFGWHAYFLRMYFAATGNTCQVNFSDKALSGNSGIAAEQELRYLI
jgi:hypothetical protein